MSINFSTLQGLTIPQGVVTQITDASGRVLWAVSGGKVVLEVEKITSNTYAGGTTYTGEQFILLDIYPKTNGTVSVTYGGLTKTITDTSGAEEPNAQQVFFGTFNGVTDSVATPASGELTIEGDYRGFSSYVIYNKTKSMTAGAICVKEIVSWGSVEILPSSAFAFNENFTSITIPNTVKSIGAAAFASCTNLTNVIIPSSVVSIGVAAFDLTSGSPRTVIMKATVPPLMELNTAGVYNSFDTVGMNNIIVPAGCSATYKAADGWSKYADYITEAS